MDQEAGDPPGALPVAPLPALPLLALNNNTHRKRKKKKKIKEKSLVSALCLREDLFQKLLVDGSVQHQAVFRVCVL
jgi:hypothetical protein